MPDYRTLGFYSPGLAQNSRDVKTVDKVVITTLAENHVDFLLPDVRNARRPGLAFQFDPKWGPLKADNGISFLIEAYAGGTKRTILMEVGFSSGVLLHNMRVLGVDPKEIDGVLISHGHPDHCGTVSEVLEAIGRPVPVYMHDDAFCPRYLALANGTIVGPYNYMILDKPTLVNHGALFVSQRNPMPISAGIWASGEIEREVEFEPNRTVDPATGAGLYYVKNGEFREDTVPDDQAIYINLKDKGVIVLTGCSHAGVINSIRKGLKVTGASKVHAVMGGMHLGFPGVPEEKVEKTIAVLRKEIEPEYLVPMHCTGFRAIAKIMDALPNRTIFNVVGTRFTFE